MRMRCLRGEERRWLLFTKCVVWYPNQGNAKKIGFSKKNRIFKKIRFLDSSSPCSRGDRPMVAINEMCGLVPPPRKCKKIGFSKQNRIKKNHISKKIIFPFF
jgi:hypothetical protein